MIILGLTGSIGMGKSTAAAMLRELGVKVHCSDEAVHELLGVGGAAVAKVGKLCPGAVIKKNKKPMIDRSILGQHVFADPAMMKKLERIIHPLVRKSEKDFITAQKKNKQRLVVLDIPLLFETGADKRLHGVILVSASTAVQRKRVLARKGMTPKRFKAIVALQMPDKEKRKKADIVIDTGVSKAQMKAQLKKIVKTFS